MINEIYDSKTQIIKNCTIADLQKIINEELSFDTINNNDGTLYVNTNGVSVYSDVFDPAITKWIDPINADPVSYLYSVMPLSNTTCIITI